VRLAALGVALVLVAMACSGDDGDTDDEAAPPSTTAPAAPPSLYDLAEGDCFSGLGRTQDLRIRIVPCRRGHQAEVYGAFTLDNRRFPGADVLRREAATQCAQHFVGYTGEPPGPNTDVAFTEVVPTVDSFTAGDRRALCIALGIDGARLRGSIAQRPQGSA
jgi:Septum formation